MGGGRKIGAYSILTTMFAGLISWAISIGRTEIPQIKTKIKVNEIEIYNNRQGIQDIKGNLQELREGQMKILEILIHK